MWINLNFDTIDANDTVVLANNRQVLALKNSWLLQKKTCILPNALSWGQYLQHTWRKIDPDANKRLIGENEVRTLLCQSMNKCGQEADNQLLDIVIKNLDYCTMHQIDIDELSQSQLKSCECFSAWIKHYQHRKRQLNLIDMNDLPQYIMQSIDKISSPYIYGFKTLTPLQSQLLGALNYKILNSEKPNKSSCNRTFKTTYDEIISAAKWAKNLHTQFPEYSIAIISPKLSQNYYQIKSIFDDVFDNTLIETGQKSYNISLGLPLCDYPLIQHLLSILKLSQQLQNNHIDTDIFNTVIVSPYITYAQTEASERAILVNKILSLSQKYLKLNKIIPLLTNTPHLKQLLELAAAQPKIRQQSLDKWLIDFDNCLILWGFATDRMLSSVEYQLLEKYQQIRLKLNALTDICKNLNPQQARSQLKNCLANIIFQAQSAKTPIQILGVLEAQGLYFDKAWVLDMTDDFLPATLNSVRFIPTDIAIKHQIPNSSFDLITQDCNNTLDNLYNLSAKVICSYAKMHLENEQFPSPMLVFNPDIKSQTNQHTSITLDTLVDTKACAVDNLNINSGVKLLQNQMACGFKGFAHRLNIPNFEPPHIGLNAAEQGNILHNILADLFATLQTRTTLLTYSNAQLNALINSQIERELKRYAPSGFIQIEHKRLYQIIQKFIEMEKQREDFSVIAREQNVQADVNGLHFTTRLDRIDEMRGGERIIFDYKTGNTPNNPWCGNPIKEAQLPIYALNNAVDGIAFIKILADKINVVGLAINSELLPHKSSKQTKCAEWGTQLNVWKTQLNQASSDYQQGEAQVLPTKDACQYCNFDSLCRVEK